MGNPRFSILIPTRDRSATFRHTLETAISQPGHDYEVVVADNFGSDATRVIVDEAVSRGHRIIYLRSDKVLSMGENWESGLRACSGDYVTVLGDDDGLMPTTLELARRVIDATQVPILAWALHGYNWSDNIVYWQADRLVVNFGDQLLWCDSRAMLREFYSERIIFDRLPLIYSSFVHRSLIERARARFGGYFVPALVAPDVGSGILNLCLCEKFIYSTRPLAVRGTSGQSSGNAQLLRRFGGAQLNRYQDEERANWSEMMHRSLIASPNIHIVIANAKLRCRELYFPDDPELTVDLERLVRVMLASIDSRREAYDENLSDALAMAAKIGVKVRPEDIPARPPPAGSKLESGPIGDGQRVTSIVVDCNSAGIYDVASAARLADSMMPPVGKFGSSKW